MHTFGLALALIVVVAALACTAGANSASVVAQPAAQGSIQARLDETVKQASAKSKGARFWVAYSIQTPSSHRR